MKLREIQWIWAEKPLQNLTPEQMTIHSTSSRDWHLGQLDTGQVQLMFKCTPGRHPASYAAFQPCPGSITLSKQPLHAVSLFPTGLSAHPLRLFRAMFPFPPLYHFCQISVPHFLLIIFYYFHVLSILFPRSWVWCNSYMLLKYIKIDMGILKSWKN